MWDWNQGAIFIRDVKFPSKGFVLFKKIVPPKKKKKFFKLKIAPLPSEVKIHVTLGKIMLFSSCCPPGLACGLVCLALFSFFYPSHP
jgi:hypothetical protein